MASVLSLQRQVLSMRYSGYHVSDIAFQLDIPVERVNRIIDKAASTVADEHRAAVVREAELLKLEELEHAFFPAAVDGSARAASTVLSLMQRRAALLGIDKVAPPVSVTFNLVGMLSRMQQERMFQQAEHIDARSPVEAIPFVEAAE